MTFLALLIAVVGALLVGPFFVDSVPRAFVDQALISAVLVAALVSVRRQRGQLIGAGAVALVAVGLGWAALVTRHTSVVLAWLILMVLFFGFVIAAMLTVVFMDRTVDTDSGQ